MVYIIAAIAWWTILLYQKNLQKFGIYEAIRSEQHDPAQKEILEEIRKISSDDMIKSKNRTNVMIFSEALVFVIFLIIGWWLINKGYNSLVVAERMKKNFLLSISHELKSPIASIRLAFETLQRFSKGDKNLNKISTQGLNESNRLNELVNNLLLTTRLEETYQADLAEVQLDEFLSKLIQRLKNKYPNSTIDYQIIPTNAVALVDATALEIILNNLIDNALKYSQPTPVIKVILQLKNGLLKGSVEDNGPGIPETETELIFDRFYRVGSEARRKTKGTGLGLFLVKRLIHWTKGRIEVANRQDSGTIFRFEIPLANKNLK
jgi:signal transduction histidine kinase